MRDDGFYWVVCDEWPWWIVAEWRVNEYDDHKGEWYISGDSSQFFDFHMTKIGKRIEPPLDPEGDS